MPIADEVAEDGAHAFVNRLRNANRRAAVLNGAVRFQVESVLRHGLCERGSNEAALLAFTMTNDRFDIHADIVRDLLKRDAAPRLPGDCNFLCRPQSRSRAE